MNNQKNIDNIGQIYLISNNVNNKVYIGQTTKYQWRSSCNGWVLYGYTERFNQHCRNSHTTNKNIKCRALCLAMRKYGVDNFRVCLLDECSVECLDEREIYYISKYESISPNGYNLESGGNYNKTASNETRQLQSNKRKKYYTSEEGILFKQKHTANLTNFNIKNNDEKKVNKYLCRTIDKIRVVNSMSEQMIYVYIYCDGLKNRNKIRFHYDDIIVGSNRVKILISKLTQNPNIIEYNGIV